MSFPKTADWTSGQIISLILFLASGALALVVFWVSRNDHDMKLLALGSVLGFISGSSATASTLLVGKPAPSSRMPDIADLAPGGKATSTETLQAPPADPST